MWKSIPWEQVTSRHKFLHDTKKLRFSWNFDFSWKLSGSFWDASRMLRESPGVFLSVQEWFSDIEQKLKNCRTFRCFFCCVLHLCMIFCDFQALHLTRVYLTDACIVQGYVYRAGRRFYESLARWTWLTVYRAHASYCKWVTKIDISNNLCVQLTSEQFS